MYTFEQVLPLIEGSYGETCCRKRVDYYYSLAVDFGKKIYHNKKRNVDSFYGEWQFRTYNRMWKIIKDEQVILQGQSNTGSNDDLDDLLQQIEFGRLINISINTDLDLVLELDNGLSIEFLSRSKEEEICVIFLPNNGYLTYHFNQDWEYDISDIQ
ncbi:hypothetical protein [Psychrobacter urativorans]|uniref:hypothetical protein n=1 Tax=Psychrobacter urativorans TaxID=45610 RepID=UPI003BB5A03C